MGFDAWLTIIVTILALIALIRDYAADMVFLTAIVLLSVFNVITPNEAFGGFVNSGVLMVAGLFIVVAGLRRTGVVDFVGQQLLGPVKTEFSALLAVCLFCAFISVFMNNTPIVAMLIPVIMSWCRKHQVAPSKLLIPLSFSTILGGCCSLIGTSTNLVVHGMMQKAGYPGMGFFEIAWVGVPCALVGVIYLLTVGRWLLPARTGLIEQFGASSREYLVEMVVQPGCRLISQSIEKAGLRHLPGLFLIEIDRRGTIIAPVSPDTVLEANDHLIFTGIVNTIIDLNNIPGLEPATEKTNISEPATTRRLSEAVISQSSPLIGQTVRAANFRSHYNAAILAIHRHGKRIQSKIGDVELEAGDTLLLQTGAHFAKAHKNNTDFYLVSDVEDSEPIEHSKARISLMIFAGLVLAMMTGIIEPAMAAFLAGGLLIATRCLSVSEARLAVDWPVIVSIGASFGLGTALDKSGAANYLSGLLVDAMQPYGPIAILACLTFITIILTELITNNGAAAIAFPFSITAAQLSGCDERPFIIGITIAASLAFSSPVGYQTHMMVYGPGGYKFTDFTKVGLPLNIMLWIISLIVIPYVWPFAKH